MREGVQNQNMLWKSLVDDLFLGSRFLWTNIAVTLISNRCLNGNQPRGNKYIYDICIEGEGVPYNRTKGSKVLKISCHGRGGTDCGRHLFMAP